jgi:hypothetical protein
MVTINHHVQVYLLSERWRGIRRNSLLDIPVELLPIMMLESRVIDERVS